ncbi:hypothetical protein C8J55DRAFT_490579 [Lentinula edodes]|uniref:Uncharacterized protein n=1 Tax=Lentinula lateritia TaxID=40482 RepID=A0A9W9A7L5_9AGAR|nr:hypothetical protein C8J55DRAFT_490579 [Lentinula edodes]
MPKASVSSVYCFHGSGYQVFAAVTLSVIFCCSLVSVLRHFGYNSMSGYVGQGFDSTSPPSKLECRQILIQYGMVHAIHLSCTEVQNKSGQFMSSGWNAFLISALLFRPSTISPPALVPTLVPALCPDLLYLLQPDLPSNNSSSSVPSQHDHYPSSNYSNTVAPDRNASEVSTTITSTSASHYPSSNYSNTVAPDYPALFVIQCKLNNLESASTAKMQTKSTSLTGKALVLSLDRAGFMKYCLSLHTLEDNFELQRPNGPAFTIYWTGSAGGKSNRLTIKDDDQYKNIQDELKKCNPNQKNFRVIVEFDLNSMINWETRKRRATDYPSTNDDFTELDSGTKVPCLDGFSEEERLVGHFVNEINKKYPCTEHKGEHGNNGTCWKDADNRHVGLNNRMKKLWAEAIVSGNATIKEPPNIPGIESTRDGVPVQHSQRCKATQIPTVKTAVTRIHIHVHIRDLTVDIIDIVLQLLHHLP